jgi:hypothetical protein
MARTALNAHAIELHSAIRRSQRDRVQSLAANRAITKTGTVAELMTIALAHFLARRPYSDAGWTWIRPEAYYRFAGYITKQLPDGSTSTVRNRLPNADWLAWHPEVVDLTVGGQVLSSALLVERLKSVADTLPKSKPSETGVSWAMYSVLVWMLEELFPLTPAEMDLAKDSTSKLDQTALLQLLEKP